MTTLTWEQVWAWRLAQQHLDMPAPAAHLPALVTEIGGLHAQMLSAAELAAGARVANITPETIRAALWQEHTLVKTWAMRGTLHLFTAAELPRLVAALTTRNYHTPAWFRYTGLTEADVAATIDAVRAALDGRALTREELADAVVTTTGRTHLREHLASGWGSMLKPAAYAGALCFGPSRGATVTFVRPDQWIADWYTVDPQEALQTVLRRFLAVYGPATLAEFARWWGTEPRVVRPAWAALAGEVAEVQVGDWRGVALAATLSQMAADPPATPVRLLPHFDPYVVGLAPQHRAALDPALHARVWRKAAWISPVVLVGGRIAGVWGYVQQRGRIVVTAEPFAPPSAAVRAGIEAAVERLGTFLGAPADLIVSQP